MPGPPQFGGGLVTNIRNTRARTGAAGWGLRAGAWCPLPRFANGRPLWFAQDAALPLFVFVGIWTPWRGVRGTKATPVEGERLLFGFLTNEANEVVAPLHPKAMPVLLTAPDELEVWLRAPWAEARELQRPSAAGMVQVVARGGREDAGERLRLRCASGPLLARTEIASGRLAVTMQCYQLLRQGGYGITNFRDTVSRPLLNFGWCKCHNRNSRNHNESWPGVALPGLLAIVELAHGTQRLQIAAITFETNLKNEGRREVMRGNSSFIAQMVPHSGSEPGAPQCSSWPQVVVSISAIKEKVEAELG